MGLFDIFKNEESEEHDSLEFFNIEIEDNGFTISNQDDKIYHEVQWADVTKVYFPGDHKTVNIELTNGKKITITHEYSNWPLFLKAVPTHYKEFDQGLVNSFFETLQGCKVCGLIAIHDEICEHCGNGVYDEDIDGIEYNTEKKYYQQMQLDFFDVLIEPDKDTIFKLDPGWIPLITQEELDVYNEENEY